MIDISDLVDRDMSVHLQEKSLVILWPYRNIRVIKSRSLLQESEWALYVRIPHSLQDSMACQTLAIPSQVESIVVGYVEGSELKGKYQEDSCFNNAK